LFTARGEEKIDWLFIQALRRAQKGRDIYFDEASVGEEPTAKRRKYVVVDQR